MQIKTITTVAGVNEIDFGNDGSQSTAHFYWLKNLSDSTLYASAMPNPVAGEDNVAELSAKGAASVETDEGKIYVLGAGKVEIHRTNSKFCPFELPSTGSGGGGGGSITVDSELSETSENPLQNKATTAAINGVKSELDTKSDVNHIHDITASGNPVTLTNLQGEVPFSEIVVSGKNLLQKMTDKTIGGLHYSPNDDGSVSVTGTQTAENYPSITSVGGMLLKSGNYTLSGGTERLQITALDIDANTVIARSKINPATFSIDTDKYVRIYVYSAGTYNGQTFDDVIYPQLELSTTPTAYEPPITGRELTVNVCGKNLLKYPYVQTTRTSYGVTFTDNGDGSITASGTHDGGTNLSYFGFSPWWANTNGGRLFLPKGNTVTLRVMGLPNTYQCQLVVKKDNTSTDTITVVHGIGESAVNYTAEQDCYIACGIIGLPSSVGQAVNFTAYPQLELGDTATEYEPYHGSTTTITPTSNPCTIPNGIQQQDGLNVISISAGELSVVGVQKNAAIKRIWDEIGMDLLFDGVTSADNPAVVNLANYNMIRIDVGGNYKGTSYFNCGSTYFSKSTLDFAFESYGNLVIAISNKPVIINISKSGAEYSLSFLGHDTKQLVDVIKIYGIK